MSPPSLLLLQPSTLLTARGRAVDRHTAGTIEAVESAFSTIPAGRLAIASEVLATLAGTLERGLHEPGPVPRLVRGAR